MTVERDRRSEILTINLKLLLDENVSYEAKGFFCYLKAKVHSLDYEQFEYVEKNNEADLLKELMERGYVLKHEGIFQLLNRW